LDFDNAAPIDMNIKRRHYPTPTKDGFDPNHPSPVFFDDQPEQRGIGKACDRTVTSSRVLKASMLIATVTAIGVSVLSVGNPVTLFSEVTASLVDNSKLQPSIDQSTPTIQSTTDAETLPPTATEAPARNEIAASGPAGQDKTETSEPPSDALFKQFQAWAAEKDEQATVGPVQQVQDVPAQVVQNAPAQAAKNARVSLQLRQEHRQVRPVHSARAEIRMQNPRRTIRPAQNVRATVRPTQDARAQDQSVQNAPSFLQTTQHLQKGQ
jgi:hypothetical protein